jgi:hypothetical protein
VVDPFFCVSGQALGHGFKLMFRPRSFDSPSFHRQFWFRYEESAPVAFRGFTGWSVWVSGFFTQNIPAIIINDNPLEIRD